MAIEMHRRLLARFGQSALVLAGLIASAGLAQAEIIVIGSNVPRIAVGALLDDGANLDIPAGARVRIILPSGRTREIKGPFNSAVGELTRGEKRDEGLWTDVKRMVLRQKRPDESVIGAVRSAAPARDAAERAAPPRPPAFSWSRVPIDADGDVCIERGARLKLARATPGRPTDVTIVDRQSQSRAVASFAVGSASADWPAEMSTEVGLYTVTTEDGTKYALRLRPISPLPAADETLRVLHIQRCLKQAEAWLAGQLMAGR